MDEGLENAWSLWECTRAKGCGPRLLSKTPLGHRVKCHNCHSEMKCVAVAEFIWQLLET